MPPFEYRPFVNPYVQSISALIQEPGQIEAQKAIAIAQAQAAAAQQRGQAWAGAATGVANAASQAIQQATDPRRQFEAMQLKQAQQLQGGQQLVDQALKGSQPVGPQPEGAGAAQTQHPYLDDQTGLVDPEKVTSLLQANGMGHLAPDLLKGIEAQNDAITKHRELQQQAGKQQAILLGSVANTTLNLMQTGMPFQDAAKHASSSLVATGTIPQAQIDQTIAQLAQLPPDQQTAQLQQLKVQAAKLGPTKTLGKDAKEVDMFGDTIASNAAPVQHVINGQLIDEKGNPIGKQIPKEADPVAAARELETARHNKEAERIQGLQVGRESAANAETARHNKAMEAANNPLAALTGGGTGAPTSAAVAEGAHGEDFLKTLPQNVASEVKAYAEGRRPFPAGFALKSPYFQSLIQMVGQYDPTFDAVNYNARSKTRNDFTSGKSSQTINALNTAIGHLDQLSNVSDALGNFHEGSLGPLTTAANSLGNAISKAKGSPKVTNFQNIVKPVADELTRVWRQAGGTEADVKAKLDGLSASNTPEQLHGAIAEIGHLLESKLDALNSQYAQGMGTTDTTGMQVVTPKAREVLSKLESRASGGSAPTTEGAQRPIPGIHDGVAEYRNGKWIRVK